MAKNKSPKQDIVDDDIIELTEVVKPGKKISSKESADEDSLSSSNFDEILNNVDENSVTKNIATNKKFPDPTPVDHVVDVNEELPMPDMDDLDSLLETLGTKKEKVQSAKDTSSAFSFDDLDDLDGFYSSDLPDKEKKLSNPADGTLDLGDLDSFSESIERQGSNKENIIDISDVDILDIDSSDQEKISSKTAPAKDVTSSEKKSKNQKPALKESEDFDIEDLGLDDIEAIEEPAKASSKEETSEDFDIEDLGLDDIEAIEEPAKASSKEETSEDFDIEDLGLDDIEAIEEPAKASSKEETSEDFDIEDLGLDDIEAIEEPAKASSKEETSEEEKTDEPLVEEYYESPEKVQENELNQQEEAEENFFLEEKLSGDELADNQESEEKIYNNEPLEVQESISSSSPKNLEDVDINELDALLDDMLAGAPVPRNEVMEVADRGSEMKENKVLGLQVEQLKQMFPRMDTIEASLNSIQEQIRDFKKVLQDKDDSFQFLQKQVSEKELKIRQLSLEIATMKENLDKVAAQAAAKVIREEITDLLSGL